jgi:putative tryptophan/tyrosine transport system substrate-binding protein
MAIDRARRKFIAALGGAAVTWPLAARAQQPAMPVIGFLCSASPDAWATRLQALRQGLSETGFDERRSVAIDYRWAEGHYERLPDLAADLVRRHVAVIVAVTLPAAAAAKRATDKAPIVFEFGADPVRSGLVASLNRPGGNVTGIVNLSNALVPKRVELMHAVVPNAELIAVLLNPDNCKFRIPSERHARGSTVAGYSD